MAVFQKTPLESWADACWFSERQRCFTSWKTNPQQEYFALLGLLLTPHLHVSNMPENQVAVISTLGLNQTILSQLTDYQEEAQWQLGLGTHDELFSEDAIAQQPILLKKNKRIDIATGHIVGYVTYYQCREAKDWGPAYQEALKKQQWIMSDHTNSLLLNVQQCFIARGRFLIDHVFFPADVPVSWSDTKPVYGNAEGQTQWMHTNNDNDLWIYSNPWRIKL